MKGKVKDCGDKKRHKTLRKKMKDYEAKWKRADSAKGENEIHEGKWEGLKYRITGK